MSVQVSIYGKLPAHADFVSVNLANAIEVQLHEWISSVIFETQNYFEKRDWLNAYLNISPLCFLLNLDSSDKDYLFGVMVPSVDRVGRYFPLVAGVYLTNKNESKFFDKELLTCIGSAIVEEQVKAMHDHYQVDRLHDNIISLQALQTFQHTHYAITTYFSINSINESLEKNPIISSCWWELDNPDQMIETMKLPSSNFYQSILSRGIKT